MPPGAYKSVTSLCSLGKLSSPQAAHANTCKRMQIKNLRVLHLKPVWALGPACLLPAQPRFILICECVGDWYVCVKVRNRNAEGGTGVRGQLGAMGGDMGFTPLPTGRPESKDECIRGGRWKHWLWLRSNFSGLPSALLGEAGWSVREGDRPALGVLWPREGCHAEGSRMRLSG